MLSLCIALRYLFSRKSHNAVNIISIISIAGVAVATMAIVCVLSVFNGFKEIAAGRLSLINPELKAVPEQGKVIAGADSLARMVTDMEDVALAVPTLSEQALASFRGTQLPVVLTGVTDRYREVVKIDSTIIDGEFILMDPYGYRAGALSVGAAITLGARPNPYEPVALFAPRRVGRINPASPIGAFRSDSVLVSGVWQIEQADIDEAGAIVSLETARDLFDYTDGEASAIEIALHPGTDTGAAKKEIAARLKGWKILDRQEQQESSFRMIAIEKWITFLMLAFILVIASFNVVSTLSMLIIEKRADMATLRSLGAERGMTSRIFLWEGWLISMVGGLAGIVTGTALCLGQQKWGWLKLNGDPTQLTITAYPVAAEWSDIAIVFALVAVVGLLIGGIAAALARR